MDVSPLSSSPSPSPDAPEKSALGKDEFVKLLMAQLGHQDPLNPLDGQAFVAQLAQFANLELLQGQSQRLDALLLAQASANQLEAASLVGREVTFRSSEVELGSARPLGLHANLAAPAASVTATVRDATGKVVRTLESGAAPAGDFSLSWDGRDENGLSLPDGRYTISFTAAAGDGSAVACEAVGKGTVRAVSFTEGFAQLLVGQARVRLADVSLISSANP